MRALLAISWILASYSASPPPALRDPDPGSTGTQSALEQSAAQFARAWAQKDAGQLARLADPGGIRLHLPGEDHLMIRPRQAQAALQNFLGRYAGGEVEVTRVSLTSGDPGEGFAELRWTTGSPEVSEPVIFTLFAAYALRAEAWVVTEIRVLF